MNVQSRIRKLEKDAGKIFRPFNTVVIVQMNDKTGIWEVLESGKVVYDGILKDIETFLTPFYEGGSTIIWDDLECAG